MAHNYDDHINVNGVKWRAQSFLTFLVQNNDARLSENCLVGSDGTLTLYASGMGAVDSTTPTIKTTNIAHKAGT